jgi:hypothetical protein
MYKKLHGEKLSVEVTQFFFFKSQEFHEFLWKMKINLNRAKSLKSLHQLWEISKIFGNEI